MSLPPLSQRGNRADLLGFALAYAARDWSIIPTNGKRPACRWKPFQQSRADEPTLRGLFLKNGITGMAVILGPVSGELACRDFDDMASYERWAESHYQHASTLPTVETHRGRHVYFRGTAGFTNFVDGEYRGTAGQYVVLPPSIHPAGKAYRWLIPLPDGPLPLVDPIEAGLCNRENGEDRENRDNGESRENPSNLEPSPMFSLFQAAEPAIVATLPAKEGERRGKLFQFARRLKAIPSLASLEAFMLRPILVEWHRRALPYIATKPLLESWADFIQAWQNVKFAAGDGPVDTALRRAAAGVPPPVIIDLYGTEGPIILLAMLCRELQKLVGDREFYLDTRTAGRLLGVDHVSAWRYLQVLVTDRILAAGTKGSNATHKASRFRFLPLEKGGDER